MNMDSQLIIFYMGLFPSRKRAKANPYTPRFLYFADVKDYFYL